MANFLMAKFAFFRGHFRHKKFVLVPEKDTFFLNVMVRNGELFYGEFGIFPWPLSPLAPPPPARIYSHIRFISLLIISKAGLFHTFQLPDFPPRAM